MAITEWHRVKMNSQAAVFLHLLGVVEMKKIQCFSFVVD